MKELRRGRNVMVVAHANTLRGLIKLIDGKFITISQIGYRGLILTSHLLAIKSSQILVTMLFKVSLEGATTSGLSHVAQPMRLWRNKQRLPYQPEFR